MHPVRSGLPLILGALLLAACGAAPSHNQAMSAQATTTASAAATRNPGPALLLVVQTKAATQDQPGSIGLFTTDGKAAGVLTLKPGANVLAVAGARIFVRASDGTLDAIRRDGSTEVLETAPNTLAGIGGLIASPDGTRWIWASQTADTSNQSIFLAGDGLAARKIGTFAYATVLQGYAWTAKGAILDSLPPDYFGYRPFNTPFAAIGGMRVVDPNTATIQKLLSPSQCVFSDESADGSIACFPTQVGFLVPNLHTLRIVSAGGKTTDLSLAVPRFNYVGDAYFSPDGSMLTVGGAVGSAVTGNGQPGSADPQKEQYATDLVQVADGSIARFGPTGAHPAMGHQSWLPAGQLVLWRPNGDGGAPGLYVLDPHGTGQSSEIEVTGTPLGYLVG